MANNFCHLLVAIILCTYSLSAQVYTVNSVFDLDDGVCDAAHCSLREAIQAANTDAGPSTIRFALPGTPPFVIQPLTPLPSLNADNTAIEGFSQPGFSTGDIVLDGGQLNGGNESGLQISGSDIRLQGLFIHHFPFRGVEVKGGKDLLIGGADSLMRNIIGNNGSYGLSVEEGAQSVNIIGNFIGVSVDGQLDIGNTIGIYLDGSVDTISDIRIENNLVSGNLSIGIFGRNLSKVFLGNNLIGTDLSGNAALPNGGSGVHMADVLDLEIGNESSRNIIAGNLGAGITLERITQQDSMRALIQNNFIGVAANGFQRLANDFDGIELRDALGVRIGGRQGLGNLISGNTLMGIRATRSGGIDITGNFIGTNSTGTQAVPNGTNGVNLTDCFSAQIHNNLVSGNRLDGIFITRNDVDLLIEGIQVTANLVGADISGTQPLGNGQNGIQCFQIDGGVDIGSTEIGTGNVVVDNNRGISLSSCTNMDIRGNFIGLDRMSGVDLGNRIAGLATLNCQNIRIGGSAPGAANIIAYNPDGVLIGVNSRACSISRNSFFCNTDSGIAIAAESNDDVGAPAYICAFPDEITGSAPPNSMVEVFQYDDSSCTNGPCQGKIYLGTTTADENGDWTLPGTYVRNTVYTATATDVNNNTSIFLECIPALERAQAIATNSGPYCEGSPIELFGEANRTGASFSWTGPNGYTSFRQNPTDAVEAGSYVLVVQKGGCPSVPDTTQVTFSTTLTINIGDEPSETLCAGEQIQINGTLYDKYNPSGVETVRGTGGACDTIYQLDLKFFPPAEFQLDSVLCQDEQLTIEGQVFDKNNPSGLVILPGAALGGCDSLIHVSLNFLEPPVHEIDTILCRGSSFIFNGAIYDENNRSGTVLLPGASQAGCDSLVNITIDFFPGAKGILDTLICREQQLVVNGTVYDANNAIGTEILPNASANGCDSLLDVRLHFLDQPKSSIDTVLCRGGSFIYEGITYNESNPSGQTNFPGTGDNACDSVVFVNVSFVDPPLIDLDTTICVGGTLLINGARYDEANPSGTEILPGQGGQCDTTLNVRVSFTTEISAEIRQTLCPGESIMVNGNIYNQARPSGTERISNDMGCDSLILIELSFYEAAVLTVEETLCKGESITINGITYNEANPSGEQQIPGGGVHGCDSSILVNLKFTNLNLEVEGRDPGCEPNAKGNILINAVSGGTAPYVYSLNGSDPQGVGNFPFRIGALSPGNYELKIADADGCEAESMIILSDAPDAYVDLGPDRVLKLGDSLLLEVKTNLLPTEIQWSPKEGLSCTSCLNPIANPQRTITYSILVTSSGGCQLSDDIRITVEEPSLLYVPNAFSPNGDAENERLLVYADLTQVDLIQRFQIFDRWGSLVFERQNFAPGDESAAWDGHLRNGQDAAAGVYIFVLAGTLLNGDLVSESGVIHLVR